jgi:hypothetical protein
MSALCSICGRGGYLENHHVEHKAMGGRGSKRPASADWVIPLCAGTGGNTDASSCHGAVHQGYLSISPDAWCVTESAPDSLLTRLNTVRGHRHLYAYIGVDSDELDEPMPLSAGEVLADSELRELLEMECKVDYLIGRELTAALKRLKGDTNALKEWLVDTYGFKPRSVASYISKRIKYASLKGEGVERLGITHGYKFALLVDKGHDLGQLMSDFTTMSREQFDATYDLSRPKKPREVKCPKCGYSWEM